MTLKEDFQKAFEKEWKEDCIENEYLTMSMWGAKWMAERCAEVASQNSKNSQTTGIQFENIAGFRIAEEIRRLAKELE